MRQCTAAAAAVPVAAVAVVAGASHHPLQDMHAGPSDHQAKAAERMESKAAIIRN